jgi:uncharacterized membrane protein AbrB (regulator of aidB expression)
MIKEILYFGMGILNDILITLYYICVGKHLAIPASLLSLSMTLLGFFVIGGAVVNANWSLIIIYAVGAAVGCFFTIRFVKKKSAKKK